MKDDSYLICPICGIHVKSLVSHLRRSHDNSLKDRKTVEERFPELKGTKMQITKFDKSKEYVCEICGKVYHRKNDVQNHMRLYHPEFYEKTISKTQPLLTCPICGKLVGNLKQHIKETHELQWDDFCRDYNWDIKLVKIITDEYRKKLSDNKKLYYKSEEGLKRKEKQSKIWKENNPSKDKELISKAIYSRTHNGNLPVRFEDMRGIKVQCNGNTFRSFNEFRFYVLCKKYNLNIKYEPSEYCVKWFNPNKKFYTTYLPDFYIDNYGLVELKADKYEVKKSLNNIKYVSVKKVYNKMGIKYTITDIHNFFKNLNIELDYLDKEYIKNFIITCVNNNDVSIITPYRHSSILKDIFNTEDLSNVECIRFTKNSRYNLYGEM